jgi:hypothetical protein
MPISKTGMNQTAVKQKADGFFDIYVFMGADRSLERLHALLTEGGLKISLTSLKGYSGTYDWQGRIREAEAATRQQADIHRLQTLEAMNEKQAFLGEMAQRLSAKGIADTFDRLSLDPTSVQLTPSDIARLMTEGSKLERLARGEVTDRTEARIHAYTVVVDQIVQVFAGVVRDHGLPQGVIDDFISGADEVVRYALTEGNPNG